MQRSGKIQRKESGMRNIEEPIYWAPIRKHGGGWICYKSTPATPAAPDYSGAAKETAAGNLEMAQYATQANRPTEITPYGSRTWTNDNNNWTSNTTLTPEAQATLDKQMGLSNRYADLATTGLDKAYKTLEDPTLDMSGIPDRVMNVGQTGQDAIMARLNPQFTQNEDALRQRLANQGVASGTEAFDNEFRQFNQGRNDAYSQAALQGIGLDAANRSSALQEQAYIQDRPLNLINALRTGSQVQNPTFGNFAQQQQTQGPDMLGATSSQYNAALGGANATNAANASNNSATAGALGTAAMAAMMFM